MEFKVNARYISKGETKTTNRFENQEFNLALTHTGERVKLDIKVKEPVEFEKLEIYTDFDYDKSCRIFTNGYQSWTVSREYTPNSSMSEFNPKFMGINKKNFNPLGMWGAGDLTFHQYPEKRGVFYGYSYGYVRKGGDIFLFGSLSEKAGYTIITFDANAFKVYIEKDLQGVTLENDKTLLELALIENSYEKAFDRYFEMMNIPPVRVDRKCGYTTWYNYYTNITQEIVERDLKAISQLNNKVDIFQIDDGYQRTVGDWLITDEKKFPDGMKAVSDSIHQKGMMSGLWLAPFAVTPKSYIFKEHKDWLVTDEKGKYHYASQNWGGFYALDIYNEEVQAYLEKVFDTVLNQWGFDMVKLDFLYACCIRPIHNKSRGEIMCDAMDLIRKWCGDKIVLGCGVPLAPAFGKVDFCRIGCDMALDWNKKPFSREDVSAVNALTNTIFRRHLDGRAWLNDPDVFLLRENNIKMPMSQRKIIALINSILGNLLFVSDDVSTYTDEQKEIFTRAVRKRDTSVESADFVSKNIIKIKYSIDGAPHVFTFNLHRGEVLQQD